MGIAKYLLAQAWKSIRKLLFADFRKSLGGDFFEKSNCYISEFRKY
jgi:hypothetical protein